MEKCIQTKNNIDLYYYPNNSLHKFCLYFYMRNGSMYEKAGQNGLTHFWEHIIFRHLNRLNGSLLYETIDRLGLELNASTYKEFIQFRVSGADFHYKKAVELFVKIFDDLSITSDDLSTERNRVKAEIRESTLKTSLEFFAQKIVWQGTTLEKTILGLNTTLNKLSLKTMKAVHHTMLSTNNIFFYITGNVSDSDIAFLADKVGEYPLSVCDEYHANIAPLPNGFFHRMKNIFIEDSYYTEVLFSYDCNFDKYTEAETRILNDILFSGDNSLINQALSETTGLIYNFDSSYERYSNIGNISFKYEISPDKLQQSVEKVMEVLKNLLASIDRNLNCAKPWYVDNAEILLDEPDNLNWVFAYEHHILNQNYHSVEERKEAFAKCTPEQIQQLSGDIFKAQNLVFAIKCNKKSKKDIRALERIIYYNIKLYLPFFAFLFT